MYERNFFMTILNAAIVGALLAVITFDISNRKKEEIDTEKNIDKIVQVEFDENDLVFNIEDLKPLEKVYLNINENTQENLTGYLEGLAKEYNVSFYKIKKDYQDEYILFEANNWNEQTEKPTDTFILVIEDDVSIVYTLVDEKEKFVIVFDLRNENNKIKTEYITTTLNKGPFQYNVKNIKYQKSKLEQLNEYYKKKRS